MIAIVATSSGIGLEVACLLPVIIYKFLYYHKSMDFRHSSPVFLLLLFPICLFVKFS